MKREQLWNRVRAEVRSVRTRVLASMLAFMSAGLVVAATVTFTIQLTELNDRVNRELLQEVSELQALALAGPGGAPYASVNELFPAFIRSGIPGGYESLLMVINGEAAYVPQGQQIIDLATPEVLSLAREQAVPNQTVLRDVSLGGSTVRLAVVSVDIAGDPAQGIMVVGNAIGLQREAIFQSLRNFAIVSVLTVLTAGVVGFALTGRLLAPVKRLREATAAVTSEQLTQRVDVPDNGDDISALATNFNLMLDRLERGFADQRQFLDDAGHELRTPLTIIRGHLELQQPDDIEDVAQTRLIVLDELDRMQRLVDDLLLLAKAQRPDFLRPDWMELDGFPEQLLERVTRLGPRTWRTDHSRITGRIWADRQRLTQAVIQLAANAVKFSGPDDIISLGAAWSPPPPDLRSEDDAGGPAGSRAGQVRQGPAGGHGAGHDGYVQLWVRDTGAGIPPEDHERIFERFGRAATGRTVEGSGLGLSIVRAIAEAHGGTVTVDSQPGGGSTFVVWIPAGGPASAPAPAADNGAVQGVEAGHGQAAAEAGGQEWRAY